MFFCKRDALLPAERQQPLPRGTTASYTGVGAGKTHRTVGSSELLALPYDLLKRTIAQCRYLRPAAQALPSVGTKPLSGYEAKRLAIRDAVQCGTARSTFF